MALAVEVAGKTDVGCVRTNNEDNFGFDSRHGIFVVCDGMGGQAAGEVASKMGVDILLDYFRSHASDVGKQSLNGQDGSSGAQSLANAIQLANKTIFQAGQKQNGRNGMGSTVVAALVRGNSLAIAHVGDSRIYLVRQGTIQQLTQDHSLVMEQVRRGYITLEQAQQSEMQNIILRALGSEEVVEADIEDLVAVSGDILLMASDGLTRYVQDDEILKIVLQPRGLEKACGELVKAARDRGGDDNITCLLVRIVDRPWYQSILNKLFFGGPQWQNSI
ncbi:MAG TPA: Stp1/IreP family PP2C-type Ser/Thr phosphatase [Candidatus Polarisedimenticolia bacterium]|jgi:protein phosphatase|nr:Stp1/IreP family PP2C-type Ser/Thr phosphatase [Candidatus Polarisedimenticolia bacterium]